MELPEHVNLALDPKSLTIDDIEVLEEITGQSLEECFASGKPRAKVLRAMAYIALRKQYPDITMEEVGQIKLGDAVITMPGMDPTNASVS